VAQTALDSLKTTGLPQAKALARDPSMTLHRWHDMVKSQGQTKPGRIWDQLAAELIIANVDQPVWAWAEHQSLPLLDFWAQLDPSIRFLLIAQTPGQALLSQAQINPTAQTDDIFMQWLAEHQRMLNFSLRHPDRSIIVWSQSVTQHPQSLAMHACERWALDWQPSGQDKPTTAQPCPLSAHLADYASQQNLHVSQFFSELKACTTPIGASQTMSVAEPLQLLKTYNALQDQAQQAAELPALKLKLQALQKQAEQANASLNAAQQDIQQKEQANKQLMAQHQEAIKAETLKVQAAQQEVQKKDQGNKQLMAQHQEAIQAETLKTQAALDTLKKEQAKAKTELTESGKQIQNLQQQLKNAQVQASQQAELKEQLQASEIKVNTLEQQRAEAQEDADTLLLQLHETQEELESYCIQNDELSKHSKALAALQTRWTQLFETHSKLYAAENLTITPEADALSPSTRYRIKCEQLNMGGRQFEQLEATLCVEADGCASISMQRPENETGPLQRWPAFCKPGSQLTLHPGSAPDTAPQRIAAFIQLTSSDWLISQNLPRLVLAALEQQPPNLDPGQTILLQTALQRYLTESKPLERFCRFNSAHLQALPSAAQLSLHIDRPSLDTQAAAQLNLDIEAHQETDSHELVITPNAWVPLNYTLRLRVTAQGWQAAQIGALQEQQLQRITSLIEILPLALVDAVHNGADKASLKPWSETIKKIRNRIQLQTSAPAAGATPETVTVTQLPPKRAASTAKDRKQPSPDAPTAAPIGKAPQTKTKTHPVADPVPVMPKASTTSQPKAKKSTSPKKPMVQAVPQAPAPDTTAAKATHNKRLNPPSKATTPRQAPAPHKNRSKAKA